ncbi:trypco2 family protein [Streptomyces olivaceus]|uniref:trypco2 family protein n=1 Tax=Streptomyces olivaceus TaxID=47716 RepID=UPI00405777DF
MTFEGIELAAAVQGVREQLILAAAAGAAEQEIKFDVEEISLEFAVELRQDVNAKAGFKAWVMSGDLGVANGRGVTHRVSMKLRPADARNGEVVSIGNDSEVNLDAFTSAG